MAQKSYIVKHESLTVGDLRNRAQVDKAVDEGRVVPPVPVYETLSAGDEVQLDEARAKSLVASGAVEPKSGSSDGLSSLKKDELEALADEHGVDLSDASNNDERAAALRDAGVTAES